MKNNFLFLGFAVPDNEMQKIIAKDSYPAIQTHKFNWNLIKGLEENKENNFTYISARPVSDYPNYPERLIKTKKWSNQLPNINLREIPFINTAVLKIITRFISGFYYSFKEFHNKKNKKGVIVYSVHIPFMYIGYIISKLYKIDFIAIWTDPPSVRNKQDSKFKKLLRNVEQSLSKYVMRRVTKVIALTKYLAEDYAPEIPYIVVEGIIDENDASDIGNHTKDEYLKKMRVVYTGSLSKRYGIENIIEGVILTNDPDIVLELYGSGDYEDRIKEICKDYDNIKYKGFISNAEILKIQRKADFLINARSSKEGFVKYSFPSKTLEYMLSGTPIIMTMLPGIPKEYGKYIIKIDDNSPEEIAKALIEAKKLDIDTRSEIGMKALEFASNKNYIEQGKIINEFIL